MDFDAFVRDIQNNQWNVFGVEVYKGGKLLHKYGDTDTSKFPIYSATKTIISIAAGMAWDQGKFELQRAILDYLPAEAVKQMPAKQIAVFKNITVERLLTMSVDGFPFRPEGESYLKYSLSCPIKDVQSKIFNYNNIAAYLVGVALTEAVEEDLFEYLNRNLFVPLQIKNPGYKRCPEGYFYGASGMELSVHDLSRIGLLLCQDGVYEGRRIVSKEYVKKATGIRQTNKEDGYGYFIWKYRDGFRISGKWQQRCYVLPERELIVTYLSHIEEDTPELLDSMEKHII